VTSENTKIRRKELGTHEYRCDKTRESESNCKYCGIDSPSFHHRTSFSNKEFFATEHM